MVFIKANDPLLCRLLDGFAARAGDGGPSLSSEVVQPFIAATLHNTVEAIPPSQLQDALWVYLYLRREFLLHTTSTTALDEAETVGGGPKSGALAFGYAVMASLADDEYGDDAEAGRGSPYALGKLEDLLRGKQDDLNATTTAADTADMGGEAPSPPGSPVGALELALAAYRHTRRLHALLTPSTLSLLVRDLESLWALLYVCKRVKQRLLKQSDLLVHRDVPLTAKSKDETLSPSTSAATAGKHSRALPADMFFHDYELLIPVHVLDSFAKSLGVSVTALLSRCASGQANRAWWEEQLILYREFAAAVQATRQHTATKKKREETTAAAAGASPEAPGNHQRHRAGIPVLRPSHSGSGKGSEEDGKTRGGAPHPTNPSLSIIINPATSSAVPNPCRQLKNKRVDVIEQAAMRYYYDRLTRLGGGRARGRGGGGEQGGDSMYTHLQAQLSQKDVTVIDPVQMERHGASESGGGAGGGPDGGAASGGLHLLPAHRRMKSLERIAAEQSSFAAFLKDSLIGFDIQVMALSGAAIGYYMGFLRGASKETCLIYAIVGLVTMMLVDAVLLLIRLSREDEATRKEKKRIAKQRAKLSAPTGTREEQTAATATVGGVAASLREQLAARQQLQEATPADVKKNQ